VTGYLDIEDADKISATGARLAGLAEGLQAQVAGLKAEIAAIEAERPWGNDHFGDGFRTSYMEPVDGQPPLRDAVLDGMDASGGLLADVGDMALQAMTRFKGGEAQNAAEIRAVNPDV